MMRRILLIAVLMIVIASVAEAQRPRSRSMWSREGRWDASLNSRFTTGKDFSGEGGSSLSFQDNLGWGFGFGYNFNENFNLGMTFGWRSVPYEAVGVDGDDSESTTRYGGRMSTSHFGAEGIYHVLKGPFTPYVSGSASWMHVDSNILAGYQPGCWWDPWWGYVCGDYPVTYGKNTSRYTLGLGGRFEMTDSFFLRVAYERGWIGSGTFDGADIFRIDLGLML